MLIRTHDLIARSASRRPDAAAVTYKDVTLTYGQLWAAVSAVARGLGDLGLRRGERVAVLLDKRPETVAAIFGTSLAGGVVVPMNPLLKSRQVAHILGDCDVRVLVTTGERLDRLRGELAAAAALTHVVVVGATTTDTAASGTPGTGTPGTGTPATAAYRVTAWPTSGSPSAPTEQRTGVDTDVAAIFYTSGSTGLPKGVVLSHRNLLVGAESVSHYLAHTADDVVLAALPLSFDAGFSQLTTAFAVGAHVILHNYVLPADVVRLCARHGVTGLTCVPPLWIQIAGIDWPAEASRRMRYFANTGGRMPRATLDRLRSVFPAARPYLMYGLTEAFRSTYLDPVEVDRRPESIGTAIPNAEILVVRPDGTECDPGEPGELVHRGPLVALGYWNDPERTAERFRPVPGRDTGLPSPDLAVWSGDLVVRDHEGYLAFVGRADDMIKTSGYRVSPTEIEEAAYDTGLVRDAVAVGVPDDRLGQLVVLLVTPVGPAGAGLDVAELTAQLRRSLPLYMVPSRVDVRGDLPRSPNGKFDRTALRGEACGSSSTEVVA